MTGPRKPMLRCSKKPTKLILDPPIGDARMSEQTPFSRDWLDMQQAYWNAWWNLSQQAMNQPTQPSVPAWSEALDMWWKAVNPAMPAQGQEMFQRFLDQSKQFFQFNESFFKTFQAFSQANAAGGDWRKVWEQTAEQMKETFAKLALNYTTPGGMLGAWELPLDNWRRTVSSLSVFPGDFLKSFKHDGVKLPGTDAFQEQIERMLSVPSVGYTREWQEQWQEGGKLWLEFQQAQEEYTEIFRRLGSHTVDRFGEKLHKLSAKGDAITGIKAFYDLWVDSGEDVYAELTGTDEYAKINARLVNTLMAWKRHGHQMVDEMLSALSMPTREEMDTLHQRMQELRRETKSLQINQATGAKIHLEELLGQITALRQEVAELKAAAPSTGSGGGASASPASAKPPSGLVEGKPARKPAARKGE
jgi:class III poly(R)-hydroxyalkanoic acid synthase PhaE subunit